MSEERRKGRVREYVGTRWAGAAIFPHLRLFFSAVSVCVTCECVFLCVSLQHFGPLFRC